MNKSKRITVVVYEKRCLKCGHVWRSEPPGARQCPKCWSWHWNEERNG